MKRLQDIHGADCRAFDPETVEHTREQLKAYNHAAEKYRADMAAMWSMHPANAQAREQRKPFKGMTVYVNGERIDRPIACISGDMDFIELEDTGAGRKRIYGRVEIVHEDGAVLRVEDE